MHLVRCCYGSLLAGTPFVWEGNSIESLGSNGGLLEALTRRIDALTTLACPYGFSASMPLRLALVASQDTFEVTRGQGSCAS